MGFRVSMSEIDDLSLRLMTVTTERNDLSGKYEGAEARIRALVEKQAEDRARHHDMSLRMEHHLGMIKTLNASRDHLQGELDREQTLTRAIKTCLAQTQVALETRSKQATTLEEQVKALTQSLNVMTRERDDEMLRALNSRMELGEAQALIRERNSRLAAMALELEKLQEVEAVERNELRTREAETKELRKEKERLTSDNDQMKVAVKDAKQLMQTAINEQDVDRQQLHKERLRNAELKTALTKSSDQVDELMTSLQNARKTKDERIMELTNLNAKMRTIIDEQKAELRGTHTQINGLEGRLATIGKALDQANELLRTHNRQVQELSQQNMGLAAKVQDSDAMIGQLEQRLKNATDVLEKQSAVVRRAEERVKEEEREVASLQVAIEQEHRQQHLLAIGGRRRMPSRRRSLDETAFARNSERIVFNGVMNERGNHNRSQSTPPLRMVVDSSRKTGTVDDCNDGNNVKNNEETTEPNNETASSMMARAYNEMRAVVSEQNQRISRFEKETQSRIRCVQLEHAKEMESAAETLLASENANKSLKGQIADLIATHDRLVSGPDQEMVILTGENEGLRERIQYLQRKIATAETGQRSRGQSTVRLAMADWAQPERPNTEHDELLGPEQNPIATEAPTVLNQIDNPNPPDNSPVAHEDRTPRSRDQRRRSTAKQSLTDWNALSYMSVRHPSANPQMVMPTGNLSPETSRISTPVSPLIAALRNVPDVSGIGNVPRSDIGSKAPKATVRASNRRQPRQPDEIVDMVQRSHRQTTAKAPPTSTENDIGDSGAIAAQDAGSSTWNAMRDEELRLAGIRRRGSLERIQRLRRDVDLLSRRKD